MIPALDYRLFTFFFTDTMACQSKLVKPNGKLEVQPETPTSPPRTTLLGTIFSPVFNFFSPANKNGNWLESLLVSSVNAFLNRSLLKHGDLQCDQLLQKKNLSWACSDY